ncbi:MAG: hypothetical protein A2Y62_22045 [Candidatus Fischerbacteria bacterium RBG_13_37_8]|uniref:Type II secretion system protein GspG C-terminal domain-containing protein n=1 Tax=Candidatus Fischerbacteria bacterium RBG_13_37_8 TaxID=1817863 RepID=A0A1F5VWY1_9BACT|nr:MAG: hypothetical protein A2Y62_22045 [Candidatus Fischerbacteria bacterium RBG_13_37_8]
MNQNIIMRLCLAVVIIMSIIGDLHAEKADAEIWNNVPQDILLVAHFRSSNPVEFYDKIYGYLTSETRNELDAWIQSMQKETSLKFREEFLLGLKGHYNLIILGNLDNLSGDLPPAFAMLQSLGNIVFALQPGDYANFEKTYNALASAELKGKEKMTLKLPAKNETAALQVPEGKIPFELLIFRDNKNTLFIGLKEAIDQIQSVQREKAPALSSLPNFTNTFRHFRKEGEVIIQVVVNPQKVTEIIKYATEVAGVADDQTRTNLASFTKKLEKSSTLLAFQAVSLDDTIFTESTIPSALYDMYYWLILSSMNEGLNRGKQTKTIAQMRTLSTALEAYLADNNEYPPLKKKKISGTMEEVLKAILEKEGIISEVPLADDWGNAFFYEKTDTDTYTLTSYGRDGKPGNCSGKGTEKSYDDDIVITSGEFTCIPQK